MNIMHSELQDQLYPLQAFLEQIFAHHKIPGISVWKTWWKYSYTSFDNIGRVQQKFTPLTKFNLTRNTLYTFFCGSASAANKHI